MMSDVDTSVSSAPRHRLSDIINDGEYWAAVVSGDKAHITSNGESLCSMVFPRNKRTRSKHENCRTQRNPDERPRWKRWDGIEEIEHDYGICGMCLNMRIGMHPTRETKEDIVSDIRRMVGLDGSGQSLTKTEMRELRTVLRHSDNNGGIE